MNTLTPPAPAAPSAECLSGDYQRKGYVPLPSLAAMDEVDAMRREIDELFSDTGLLHPDNLRAQGRPTVDGGYVVDRLDPLMDLAESVGLFATSPRVLEMLRTLMGEDMLLFKDKLIYKRPGTTGYRTHQDYTYWLELPASGGEIVSLMVALDPTGPENGATEFFPGCHHRHLLENRRPQDIFDPTQGLSESSADLQAVEPEMFSLAPGDAVAFSSLSPHRSAPNISQGPRRQLFLTYAPARYGSLYDRYYSLFRSYMVDDRRREGKTTEAFFR